MAKRKCNHKGRPTFTKEKGPHTGLYCKGCGRWIKWVASIPKPNLALAKLLQESREQTNAEKAENNFGFTDFSRHNKHGFRTKTKRP